MADHIAYLIANSDDTYTFNTNTNPLVELDVCAVLDNGRRESSGGLHNCTISYAACAAREREINRSTILTATDGEN